MRRFAIMLLWMLPAALLAEPPATRPVFDPAVQALVMSWPTIESAVRVSIEKDQLKLSSDLPEAAETVLVRIADFPGATEVRRSGLAEFSVKHTSPAPPGHTIIYHFSAIGGGVQMSVMSENDRILRQVQYIQRHLDPDAPNAEEKRITLYIDVMDQAKDHKTLDLDLSADSLSELRRKYPREVSDFLQPLLAAINQEDAAFRVDHRTAWQVLAHHWPIEPAVEKQVNALVAQLDADEFAARESAAEALEKLGEAGAVVLLRSPRRNWTSEQATRVDAVLAPYRPLSPEQATSTATDLVFLLDCLYTDNATIRRATVAQLKQVTGRPIELNADAPRREWLKAVRAVRQQLLPAATTQKSPPTTE